MERHDFTDPQKSLNFLGSYWAKFFDNGIFGSAIAEFMAECQKQSYKDLVRSVNSVSVSTVPVFKRATSIPIDVYRSELEDNTIESRYGDNTVYGIQDETSMADGILAYGARVRSKNKFFIKVPDRLKKSSRKFWHILSGLYEPDIIYSRESDFIFEGDYLVFRENPFEHPLARIDRVQRGDEIEEKITLWAAEVDLDENDIFKNFGCIFSRISSSSVHYKRVAESFLRLLSGGPSLQNIQSFFAAAGGVPQIIEENELVESIFNSPDGWVINTDKNVYLIPPKQTINEAIEVGDILSKGTPLSTAIEVISPLTNKKWWRSLSSLPARNIFDYGGESFLSFPNKMVPARTIQIQGAETGVTRHTIRFDLEGDQRQIENFWKKVDKNTFNQSEDIFLDIFDKIPCQTTPSGQKMVNPAQILSEYILGPSVLPIFIDFSQIEDAQFLFGSISAAIANLSGAFPIYLHLMIFGKMSAPVDVFDSQCISDSTTDHHFLGQFDSETICVSPSEGVLSDELYGTEDNPSPETGESVRFIAEKILLRTRSKCAT